MTDDPTAPAATPEPQAPAPAAPATPATAPTADELRAELQAELAAHLKAATGHDSVQAIQAELSSARDYRQRLEAETVRGAILSAAREAIDPELIVQLLGAGAKLGDDGAVTVGGKPAAEAVAELLDARPYLAKPVGTVGSGMPSGGFHAPAGRRVPRNQFDSMSPGDRMTFIRSGGTLTD